ncbi:MAG: hypothetical protein REJ23_11070 [Brevundimonas sp.]|nr:hypothetical protein [Brevundimonas sp.]
MRIDGHIHIGEGARWAGKACGRLNGYPWTTLAGVFLGAVAVIPALIISSIATHLLGAPGWTSLPILLAVLLPATILAIRIVRNGMVAYFRKQLTRRGVSNPLPWRLEIVGETVIWLTGDLESRAPARAVSEVFPVGPYWVLLIQGTPVFVARRNFAGKDAQRAFLTELLAVMTPDARDRSKAAVRFVG